jgi:hypothetical protein
MVDMRQKYNLRQKYNFFMFRRKINILKIKIFWFFLDSRQLLYVGNLSMKKKSKKFIINHFISFLSQTILFLKKFLPVGDGSCEQFLPISNRKPKS